MNEIQLTDDYIKIAGENLASYMKENVELLFNKYQSLRRKVESLEERIDILEKEKNNA